VTGTVAALYPAFAASVSLRAPMDSADSRLIFVAGCKPERTFRFGESRSDLFCHHSQVPAQPFEISSSDLQS
jgi:hypothetical protein